MTEKIYHFQDIGNITFVKNKRAKALRITVKPDRGVKVTIPGNISLTHAFRFVEEKTEWIRKSLEKVKTFEQRNTVFKPDASFSTMFHALEFNQISTDHLTAKVGNGKIRIYYKDESQVLSAEGQEFIRKAIIHALRKEAKYYLPERIHKLSEKFGFSHKDVRVKNLKSRWGSCSSTNNINLNLHLMRLPSHLIDYVILHELVHTVHKNHGKYFWKALQEVSGDARGLAKEMKSYRTQSY